MQILSKIVAPEMTSKQEKKPKLVANLVKAEEKPHDVKPAVNTAGLDDPENTANTCGDIVTMSGRRYLFIYYIFSKALFRKIKAFMHITKV